MDLNVIELSGKVGSSCNAACEAVAYIAAIRFELELLKTGASTGGETTLVLASRLGESLEVLAADWFPRQREYIGLFDVPAKVDGKPYDSYHAAVTDISRRSFEHLRSSINTVAPEAWKASRVIKEKFLRHWPVFAEVCRLTGFPAWTIEYAAELKVMLRKEAARLAAKQPALIGPKVVVKLDPPQIVIDGDAYALPNRKMAGLFKAMVDARGESISATDHSVRTRDLEKLPLEIKAIIDSQGGKGTRILPKFLGLD